MNAPDSLREGILEALYEIAPEARGVPLADEVSLREQLDLDSVDLLRFLIALKAKVGVEVPEVDYGKLVTLGGCLAYLRRRIEHPTAEGISAPGA